MGRTVNAAGVKNHVLKVWTENWTKSSIHQVIVFEALLNELNDAGVNAEIVFNVDGDAYVIEAQSSTGQVLEIGPGTLTIINGEQVLTSRVSGLNVYREDGSAVESSTANEFELFVLAVIDTCR